MSGYGSGGGYGDVDDERVHHVLSQDTIDRAMAADASRRSQQQQQQQQASSHTHSSNCSHNSSSHHSSSHSANRGDVVPGITRRDTTTRRDPLTGDLIEDYTGTDPNGPSMRAHHNWDEPEKSPYGSNQPSNEPRPGHVQRTNTTISYNSSGDRIEDHDGEGSLEIRAMYNQDDDTSTTYRPAGPARGQSERDSRDRRY